MRGPGKGKQAPGPESKKAKQMEFYKKPQLAPTMAALEIGGEIAVPQEVFSEASVRNAANRLKRSCGIVFKVSREGRGVRVIRVA